MTGTIGKVFGIDLGTTYSCIAHVDETGRATLIPDADGSNYTTPSVVWFDGDTRVVGQEAKANAIIHPDDVMTMVKRQMGVEAWKATLQGKEYTAPEISAYILRKLADDARQATGEPVTDVVITCPAYFGPSEREATAQAGKLAGLNVRAIINEPTAAAISYGMRNASNQVVMIYDLGGGTFDVTIIEIKDGAFTVIATGGDHHLGGHDWDTVVLNYLAEQWMEQSGSSDNPLSDTYMQQELNLRAERAKIALTGKTETMVPIAFNGTSKGIQLTRAKFDELTADLLAKTIFLTNEMLTAAADKGYHRFDQILLVGGSTKMPQVRERLQKEYDCEPKFEEPDFAVAKGAALYGQSLALGDAIRIIIEEWEGQGRKGTQEEMRAKAEAQVAREANMTLPAVRKSTGTVVKTVTSRSFGVAAYDKNDVERVTNIILVQTVLPAEGTQTFGTREANQRSAEIRVLENIVPDQQAELDDSKEIGTAVLDLPPGLREGAPIQVTFELDEQGLLHATAVDITGGRRINVNIETSRVMSEEQLQEAMKRAKGVKVTG